jgi:hypothetical protein
MAAGNKSYLLPIRAAILAIALAGTSCSNTTQPQVSAADGARSNPAPAVTKCDEVDVSPTATARSCFLKKARFDEIIWENSGNTPIYVCIDPTNDPNNGPSRDPFGAYAWYVLPGAFVKSGPIKVGVNPDANRIYEFYSGSSPCTVPPTRASNTVTMVNTPHVVIQ